MFPSFVLFLSHSLQKCETTEVLSSLCNLMEEEDQEKAALALQKYFERGIVNDKELHRLGCLGESNFFSDFFLFSIKILNFHLNIEFDSATKTCTLIAL